MRPFVPLAFTLIGGAALVLPLPAPEIQPAGGRAVTLVTTETGNEVRYRVREQLLGVDLPNDAIGRTSAVTGTLVLDDQGAVVPGESEFVIQVGGLTSDKDRRDGYVRSRLLETEQHPTVVFQPNRIEGLQGALPTSGSRTLSMRGNLTIKGVTRPVTWQMNTTFTADGASGSAVTGFTFDDFSLTKPRVRVVLSVEDSIHLEYDFRVRRQ